jgi:hypothetical protein
MAFGLAIYNAAGVEVFNSITAGGGVMLAQRSTTNTEATVITYPALAGATPSLQPMVPGGIDGVTLDTTLGYPRLTIAPGGPASGRVFAVMAR